MDIVNRHLRLVCQASIVEERHLKATGSEWAVVHEYRGWRAKSPLDIVLITLTQTCIALPCEIKLSMANKIKRAVLQVKGSSVK